MDAAHVRVQRPLERHAAHAVERHLARLLAILDPHMATIEHMFDGHRAGSPCRCRCGRATSTATCSRARTAGRWWTPASGCPSRTRCSPRSPAARIARIVITHFHPDHVGGAQQAQAATGATVHQGALDYEQCAHVWGNDDWLQVIADWFLANGVPPAEANELLEAGSRLRAVHPLTCATRAASRGRRRRRLGVLAMPGHADGHLVLVARRRPRRGRPPAAADHAGGRPLPGLEPPTRSATTSTRSSARGARRAARAAGPRRADPRPDRPRSGDRRAPP